VPQHTDGAGAARRPALLVVGACFLTRCPGFVHAAGRRGMAVLGIDALNPLTAGIDASRRRVPEHPMAPLAEFAWVPAEEPRDVLEQVLTWCAGYEPKAVVGLGESYVEAAALVADCLGLRGPGLRASRVSRNKLLQRRYLAEWSPASRLVPPAERAEVAAGWDAFPAIVKPTGRTASSGVRRVGDRAAMRAAFEQLMPVEPALVETLVEGPELSVESLVADGEVVFAAPTGKRTNELDGTHFVEMGHTVPDPLLSATQWKSVQAANAAILDRLAFRDGAAHAEMRVGPDGEVTLMEIAARPAGDLIYSLYHLATGSPMEETFTAILLGEPVASHPAPRRHARQVYLPQEPGILRDVRADGLDHPVTRLPKHWIWPAVTPLPPDAPAAVHMIASTRLPGAELREIQESWDRTALFVIDAPTTDELDRLEARCWSAVRMDIDTEGR
jgi:hypothetical protein